MHHKRNNNSIYSQVTSLNVVVAVCEVLVVKGEDLGQRHAWMLRFVCILKVSAAEKT